jgi:hypothetical protein
MDYVTKYNYIDDPGFPPPLARLTDDPVEKRSAELYLAVPKKWIPIGDPVVGEMMFTGEWGPVWPRDVDTVIERIEARRRPKRSRYWLVSLDPDAPHVMARSYQAGPLESYMLSKRKWITPPADDPLLQADRADWNEMLLKETAIVGECLEHGWDRRRAFPDSNAEHR